MVVVAGRSVGVGVLEPCVCVACGSWNRCDAEWHFRGFKCLSSMC